VIQANKGVPNKVLQANKVGQATKMVQANKGVPIKVVQATKMVQANKVVQATKMVNTTDQVHIGKHAQNQAQVQNHKHKVIYHKHTLIFQIRTSYHA
jgi:hypothetical protein